MHLGDAFGDVVGIGTADPVVRREAVRVGDRVDYEDVIEHGCLLEETGNAV